MAIQLSPDVRKFAEQMELEIRKWDNGTKNKEWEDLIEDLEVIYTAYMYVDEGKPECLEYAANVANYLMLISKAEGLLK